MEPTLIEKIRGGAFYAAMAALTVILGGLLAPVALFSADAAGRCIRLWAKAVLVTLRLICDVRMEIIGANRLPTGPAIVASNHQSMWETIAFYALLPRASIVFKRELLSIPIYGWWAVRAGNIVIDRGAGARAIRTVTKAARARLEAGAQIVIFPEGTRAPPGERFPLQPGVAGLYAATGMPVTPVIHDSGRRWLYPGLAKRAGVIRVIVGDAVAPGADRRAFLKALEEAFDQGLVRLGRTEALAREAARQGYSGETGAPTGDLS